jgi:hypothetical protein
VGETDQTANEVIGWMAGNRETLDLLMTEEGSRSVHEEFIAAEGGVLPTRQERLERARRASSRAWLRYFACALSATWAPGDDGLEGRLDTWIRTRGERREALRMDEEVALERRGRSGDPEGDARAVDLAADRRFFAEALASSLTVAELEPPVFGKAVADWGANHRDRLNDLQLEALSAAPGVDGEQPAEMDLLWERSPEVARSVEAAIVWANLRFLAEALASELPNVG